VAGTGEQNLIRVEGAVHDGAPVCVIQRGSDRAGDPNEFGAVGRRSVADQFGGAVALDVLHTLKKP
jgi:hypothetical protein